MEKRNYISSSHSEIETSVVHKLVSLTLSFASNIFNTLRNITSIEVCNPEIIDRTNDGLAYLLVYSTLVWVQIESRPFSVALKSRQQLLNVTNLRIAL